MLIFFQYLLLMYFLLMQTIHLQHICLIHHFDKIQINPPFIIEETKTELSAVSSLTLREREILQLLAEGLTAKEIASHLNVSTKTLEVHRQHIMDKLDIHNVVQLTRYAIREGLTSP